MPPIQHACQKETFAELVSIVFGIYNKLEKVLHRGIVVNLIWVELKDWTVIAYSLKFRSSQKGARNQI